MKTLERLADLWSLSSQRRQLTSEMRGVYSGTWTDARGTHLLREVLMERYPHTAFMLWEVRDTSVNAYRWACSKLGAIYSRPPARKLEGLECPELYDNVRTNLALSGLCKQTWALRQSLVRPLLGENGLTLQYFSPEFFVAIPDPFDPFRLKALMYQIYERRREQTRPLYVVWTENIHRVFEDPLLQVRVPQKGNPDGINPYSCVPFVLAHAEWPETTDPYRCLDPWKAHSLYHATIEAAVAFTQLRHVFRWASGRQVWFKGKAGKDFNRNAVLDVANPFTLSKEGEVGVLDLEVDVVAQVEAAIKLLETPLSLEGFRPEMLKGSVTATSGADRKLQMTELEERREDARTVYREFEQACYNTCAEVVRVERRRADLGHNPELPPGRITVEYAEIGAEMSLSEQVDLWVKRLSNQLGTVEEALEDIDDISAEEAAERAAKIQLAFSKAARAKMLPPP